MARGIRKVGENILAPKRAIIVTDKNKSQYIFRKNIAQIIDIEIVQNN